MPEIDLEQLIKEQGGCGKYVGSYRCGTVIVCEECIAKRHPQPFFPPTLEEPSA